MEKEKTTPEGQQEKEQHRNFQGVDQDPAKEKERGEQAGKEALTGKKTDAIFQKINTGQQLISQANSF